MFQGLDDFLLARDVVTATRDSDGKIMGCIDAPVSIIRSKERDSDVEFITH